MWSNLIPARDSGHTLVTNGYVSQILPFSILPFCGDGKSVFISCGTGLKKYRQLIKGTNHNT